MAVWSRFQSILFGGAIGAAARTAIEPQIEPARQLAWSNNQNRVLELEVLGVLVAQGLVGVADAEQEAGRTGFAPNRLHAVAELAQKAPTIAEALTLRRRGRITPEQLEHAFAKAQIEPAWWPELARLVDERLSPQVVALAIVRGLIRDPGILPVGPPSGVGKVKAFPVFSIDAETEAQAEGFNLERLSVLAGIAGRPMGPEAAAAAVFRGIIERIDYERAIAEGDVRNEWADAIFETARFVVSPQDAAGLRLRGWKTKKEAEDLGALHGASPETMELLYLNRGRPAAPGQMATAAARGIDGPLGRPMDLEQFMLGVQESDIRPEWGKMLWESRWLYPSLFQLNRLVTGGTVTPEVGASWAAKARYAPEVVAALLRSWQGAGSSASAKWASRAQARLFTTAHSEYLAFAIDEPEARRLLASLGAVGGEQDSVIALWDAERAIVRLELTPAQVRKAWKKGLYTEDQAVTALEERGMTIADAETFLQSG